MKYPEANPTTKISAKSTDPIWFPGKNCDVFTNPKNIPKIIGIVKKPQTGQTATIKLKKL